MSPHFPECLARKLRDLMLGRPGDEPGPLLGCCSPGF